VENCYLKAKKRLFLFDYDVSSIRKNSTECLGNFLMLHILRHQGTLTPIVKIPSMAVPSEATLEALEKLCADPKNLVYIISGRDGDFLIQHLGHINGLGMSAEHGGFMRAPGETKWTNFTEVLDMSWMQEVEEIFKYYTEVSAKLPTGVVHKIEPPILSLPLLVENDRKPHRSQKEFNHLALPCLGSRMGSLPV
jgi:trehalose 6-phosphate synthase/phosphatase